MNGSYFNMTRSHGKFLKRGEKYFAYDRIISQYESVMYAYFLVEILLEREVIPILYPLTPSPFPRGGDVAKVNPIF